MEVISQRSSSSTLNPNAPMFIPFAYRTVEDFSDQWWSLIQSSPWFRDYWLQERYFDSQIEDFSLPDLDDLFDDEFQEEEEEEEVEDKVSKEIVSMGSSKWKKGRVPFEKQRCVEKAPKIVNVKLFDLSFRKFVKGSLLRKFDNAPEAMIFRGNSMESTLEIAYGQMGLVSHFRNLTMPLIMRRNVSDF
ncbi:hypothetical protein LWI29_018195 [Acer saccharum]|uniref:Uncharacterized protein n=1 Tax=Acer saccharum TaxID=4024 RepID=A0AA39SKJ5_ACESA|nr:hypothetical protein LWI29_018195 [Acer saccharum]